MTETRKGERLSGGVRPDCGENRNAALAACEAVMATIPARNSRRANWTGMTGSSPALRSDLGGSRQRKAQTNLHHRNLKAVAERTRFNDFRGERMKRCWHLPFFANSADYLCVLRD